MVSQCRPIGFLNKMRSRVVVMVQKLARGDLGFLPHMSEVVWDVVFFARVRIFLL